MRWLAAIGVFILALVTNVPFFGALLLGAITWLVVHFAMKERRDSRDTPEGVEVRPGSRRVGGDIPDVSDPLILRSYLRELADRLQALEDKLAALLAVVVVKLFLVHLANTGTIARIVSFLGVGVMLLVIGYVAPVPPGARETEKG